ncbi:MAG: hypothetical protein J1F64_05820 [Oscillospiraceae bacterium]|nr:hypothetical protein [Oscillospiraceae bacterium]
MKYETTITAVCPKCGKTYTGRPAISREDNETPICTDCGTRDALAHIHIDKDEQDKILEIIHRYTGNN